MRGGNGVRRRHGDSSKRKGGRAGRESSEACGMTVRVQVQYLEIYNEKIRDLLAPNREDLKVCAA
eukprot:1173218-Rhodomonas_salina.1